MVASLINGWYMPAIFHKTKWVDLNAVQTSLTSFVDLKNGNSRDRNVSVTVSGMVVLACQNGQKKTEIKKSKNNNQKLISD
jgi:hypothetical protein